MARYECQSDVRDLQCRRFEEVFRAWKLTRGIEHHFGTALGIALELASNLA